MRSRNECDYKAWLHGSEWRRLRLSVLTEHPWCADCLRNRKRTAATEVHHIRPVLSEKSEAERRRIMYDRGNLVALCHDCHMARHTSKKRRVSFAAGKKKN